MYHTLMASLNVSLSDSSGEGGSTSKQNAGFTTATHTISLYVLFRHVNNYKKTSALGNHSRQLGTSHCRTILHASTGRHGRPRYQD